jgi:hypothetical protein
MSLKELPAALTAGALLAGVVVYGLLATAYDEFYAELGLTPSDVGISYGQALGGAAALSVLVVLLMVGLTLAFWWAARRVPVGKVAQRVWVYLVLVVGFAVVVALLAGSLAGLVFLAVAIFLFVGAHPKVRVAVAPVVVAAVCGAGFSFLVLTGAISHYADSVADHIKAGGWVEPPAAGGMVFFSVRAMPATVMAENNTGPAIASPNASTTIGSASSARPTACS